MQATMDDIKIHLQIGLNKRMYEIGKIPYEMYSKANEILISRLQSRGKCDIITSEEMIS